MLSSICDEPLQAQSHTEGRKGEISRAFPFHRSQQTDSIARKMYSAKLAVKSLQYVINLPEISYGTSPRTDYHD